MASFRESSLISAFDKAQPKLLCLDGVNLSICDGNTGFKATEIKNKIKISSKESSEEGHSLLRDSTVAIFEIADNSIPSDFSSKQIEEIYCAEKSSKSPLSNGQNIEPIIKEDFIAIPPLGRERELSSKQIMIEENICVNVMDHSQKFSESKFEDLPSICSIDDCAFEDSIEMKCLSILKLAKTLLKEPPQAHLYETDDLSIIFKAFLDNLASQDYVLCFSILLCVVTCFPSNEESIKAIESHLMKLLQATKPNKKCDGTSPTNEIGGYEVGLLPNNVQDKAIEICKEMKISDDWELSSIDLCFLACTSLKNLFASPSGQFKRYGCNPDILRCVIEKIHEAVQLLALSKPICAMDSTNDYHSNLRVICQCLQVLEQASFMNPDNKKCILGFQNFIVSRHCNRLLGFCLKSLFYNDDSMSQFSQLPSQESSKLREVNNLQFYFKSCLVCILKVLLNVTHDCKEAVIKLGAIDGLMEKLLMCTLNVCSKTSDEQFEVLILCLELIINLIEPSWSNRKVFAVLCLKRFDGSKEEGALAVELLIQILVERLNEIKLLEKLNDEAAKEVELHPENNRKERETARGPDEMKANIVFQAAGKHMEQSMICTYISILLGFFVDMKKSFRELVQKKMTQEIVNQAVLVSKGFLSFIELTEGMSKKGIKSLTTMLATLQAIHVDR